MLQAVELTPEQINQLIQFINEGKYSWTCVLLLRFLGENPPSFHSPAHLQPIDERKSKKFRYHRF
jgi:hypothetical protein